MKTIIAYVLVVFSILLFFAPQPTWAATSTETYSNAQPQRTNLTLELLQERLKAPAQIEGVRSLDLRRLNIDLRPENAAFRDQFYQLLKSQLQRSGSPLGLDLSYSLIQGDLEIRELGLRTPLYGQALSPIFTATEQEQLQRDRRRLSQLSQLSRSLLIQTSTVPSQITVFRGTLTLVQTRFAGTVDASNTFFLGRVEAQGADFTQDTNWSETRFSQLVNFTGSVFQREARFRSSIFFARAKFSQVQFQGLANFQNSEFQATANFNRVVFQQFADFSRIQWQSNADFAQASWQDQTTFARDKFSQSLFLTDATFEKSAMFREVQFSQPVNLRGASILAQVDFGDARFAVEAYLNLANLKFDAEQAKLLGDPGQIGRFLSVPTLQGNETLLRNLVRNFRLLEQIPDANQVEYTTERLRLKELRQRLLGLNVNTAPISQLLKVGFSAEQAAAIVDNRTQQPFRVPSDLLRLKGVDLATYVKVRDRIVAGESLAAMTWLLDGFHWLGLSLLLLLSRYGTSFWLTFGVGMVAIAYFGLLFWLIDRVRRLRPQPIIPTLGEWVWVLSSFSLLTSSGLAAVFRTADRPWLTLACLGMVSIPAPIILLVLYRQGRYHDLMNVSYFVEDGSLRQLRLLIGRLPIMPRFPFFRDRYLPILWDRRWNWLNYYDFSLNNLLKFGFNDIRLRDEALPGLITSLVWYQWGLGVLYVALLLWTLSRTIPGLNLLIYFK